MRMQRTCVFVPDAAAYYADEADPISLAEFADVDKPLTLQGDRVHFYNGASDALLDGLRKNPFTRQPIAGIHEWEPIVHPGTTSAAYLELIASLHRRGWSNAKSMVNDITALRALDPHHDLARLDLASSIDWYRDAMGIPKPRIVRGYGFHPRQR
jgi:hypothetical protein